MNLYDGVNAVDLHNLMPTLSNNVEVHGDRIAIENMVSEYVFERMDVDERERLVRYTWEQMYHSITMTIAQLAMGTNYHWITGYKASIIQNYDSVTMPGTKFRLICYISASNSPYMTVPKFHGSGSDIHSWTCGRCGSRLGIQHRTCTSCGVPRTLLVEEALENID